jgi:hypothetical protein
MDVHEIEQLWTRAMRCRRLAWTLSDPATSLALHELAASYEAQIHTPHDEQRESRAVRTISRRRIPGSRSRPFG